MDGRRRFTESEAREKLLQFRPHEKAYFPCAEPTMIIYVKLQVENARLFQDKLNSKQQKNNMDGCRLKKNCYNFGLIKDLFPF